VSIRLCSVVQLYLGKNVCIKSRVKNCVKNHVLELKAKVLYI